MTAGETNPVADRFAFWKWAAGHRDLRCAERSVLEFIVNRLVGRDRAMPFRGWAKLQVLIDQCGCSERSARRSLASLEARGWIVRTSVRGRTGRIFIDLPLAAGAAKRLQARPYGKAESAAWQEANPSQTGQKCRVNDGHKPAKFAGFGVTNRPNLQGESSYWPSTSYRKEELSNGSGADAADLRSAARPDFKSGEGAGRGLRQERGGPLDSLAAARLLKRLRAIAAKGKVEPIDWPAFFAGDSGENRFRRWLRLQREERDPQLVHEALEAIADWQGCNPVDLGAAVGRANGRRRWQQPEPPKANGSAHHHYGDNEISRARKAWTDEQMRASAERLGMKRKGAGP